MLIRLCFQEALDSLFQALGDDLSAKHPLVGRALTDRAVLAFLEGDYDGAIELGTEADKVYRTVLRGLFVTASEWHALVRDSCAAANRMAQRFAWSDVHGTAASQGPIHSRSWTRLGAAPQ